MPLKLKSYSNTIFDLEDLKVMSDKTGHALINRDSNFYFPKLTKKEKNKDGNLYIGAPNSSQFKVNQIEIYVIEI